MQNLYKLSALFPFFWCVQSNAQNSGDLLFESAKVHDIRITSYLSYQTLWDSLKYYKDNEQIYGSQYMKVDISIDGDNIDDVGIKMKGNSSYGGPGDKKPLKIDFDKYVKGQDYDGIDKFVLNNYTADPSFMREKLHYDLLKMIGVPAPRATYANIYVNNNLVGMYGLVEYVEKTFLKDQVGDSDGNLFKGDPNGTLQWKGNYESDYYGSYELKTNEDVNDWSDLVNLVDQINNSSDNSFVSATEKVIDTDIFIKNWAVMNLLVSADSYMGGGHNYYIYHNTVTDLFEFITWDCNESFGMTFTDKMSLTDIYNLPYDYTGYQFQTSKPLIDRMLNNQTYKLAYLSFLKYLVSDIFTENIWYPYIDSLVTVLKPYLSVDPNFSFSISTFEQSIDQSINGGMMDIPGIKPFISNRRSNIVSYLTSFGFVFTEVNKVYSGENISIYPNPSNSFALICNDYPENVSGGIYNSVGEKVAAIQINKQETFRFSPLIKGTYYVILYYENSVAYSAPMIFQ